MTRERQSKKTVPAQLDTVFPQIINALSSGVIALDRDGVVVCANRAACAHLGVEPEAIRPGLRLEELALVGPLVDVVREVALTHAPVTRRELVLSLGPGIQKEIGLSASLLEGPEAFNGVVLLFTDMTDRRSLERAAEINRQLASLGELTAGVVHELRNPLSVISGMSELLIRKLSADEGLREIAETIFEEAGGLERAISLFLGFARPFSEVQVAPCNPEEIIERAVRLCRRRAQDKKVTLMSTVAEDLPRIQADVSRTAQALVNVLNNAIDAAPAETGEVNVRTCVDRAYVLFEVTDNGPGVQLAQGEDLFAPFFTKKEGGTGLGLSIVHRIISAHGGSISYRNREEGGVRFEIRLPIRRQG